MLRSILRSKLVCVGAFLMAVATISIVCALVSLGSPKVELVRPDSRDTQFVEASLVKAPSLGSCTTVRKSTRPLLSLPYRLCDIPSGDGGGRVFVRAGERGSASEGLVLDVGVSARQEGGAPEACNHYLGHSWWAFVNVNLNESPDPECPAGYRFS
jgi:hypothetical protein